jgi:hypothetical protein
MQYNIIDDGLEAKESEFSRLNYRTLVYRTHLIVSIAHTYTRNTHTHTDDGLEAKESEFSRLNYRTLVYRARLVVKARDAKDVFADTHAVDMLFAQAAADVKTVRYPGRCWKSCFPKKNATVH